VSKTIEIDDDIYDLIRNNVREFRETESTVLRRLLKANGGPPPEGPAGGKICEAQRVAPAAGAATKRPTLAEMVSSGAFAYRRATDRYLKILAFVHSDKLEFFERILEITGRRRVYFGRSEKDIAANGKSTHPQPIAKTGYWALTNASTDHKRAILEMALRKLGYDEMDVRAACSVLG
jgi:negative modulator of initiation of replication